MVPNTNIKLVSIKMLFLLTFFGLFFLVGFGLLGYGLWSAQRSLGAGRWPTTPGVIKHCELASTSDGDSGTNYQVIVQVDYKVGGKEYRGDTLAFAYSASSSEETHRQIFEKLKQAEVVDVRYDPFDPGKSVLSYGLHRSIRFVLVFAVTWLAFMIGFVLLWWTSVGPDEILLDNLSTR